MQRFLRIFFPLLIVAAGYGAWQWIGRPEEAPAPELRPPALIRVEIEELRARDYPVVVETQGVVRAPHVTNLTPQVSGTITAISPSFADGAFFRKGEELLTLDPADYEAALIAAEAQLARAEAALAQEQARAKQARLNWEDIGYDEEPSDLVLRVPQLKEANANVDSAIGAVDQARRNLERTHIRAPFDGRVKTRTVGLGQSVSANTPLGEIFSTAYAEIRLPLSPRELPFVDLPLTATDSPVEVTLRDALDPSDHAPTWKARIVRTEGTLDESSRTLFTIARLDDPFGLTTGRPPLRIGQPVRAEIAGKVLQDVVVIPRHTLRGVNTVYRVLPDATLDRTRIKPLWSNAADVVIEQGLEEGDRLVVSRLPYAPDGAKVEIVSSLSDPRDDAHVNAEAPGSDS